VRRITANVTKPGFGVSILLRGRRHSAGRRIAPGGPWDAYTSKGLYRQPGGQGRRGLSQPLDTKQTSDARGSVFLLVMSGHAVGSPNAWWRFLLDLSFRRQLTQ
jgi:hypothetical protein